MTEEFDVAIQDILIRDDRQRKEVDLAAIDSLAVSMSSKGMIHPITVQKMDNGKWTLWTGYRRFLAAQKLKWVTLRAKPLEGLNQLELRELELDENLKRENLTWQEEVKAMAEMADLRKHLYGDNLREVAEHTNTSRGTVWGDTQLAKAIELVPDLAKCETKSQALRKLALLQRRVTLMQKVETEHPPEDPGDVSTRVYLGDCIKTVKEWPDEIVHLVCTDPPYGIELDDGTTKKGNLHPEIYQDDHYDIMDLISLVAREAYRLLKPDAHAYFWFDIKAYDRVFQTLSAVGFKVDPIPLVWVKNMAGQTNHPDSRWGNAYEVCFFCRKGNRALLKQGQSNLLKFDVVPPAKKIHPTEKPSALLRHLVESSTVPGEVVLDFFGGSGSTAEAAIQTGRNFMICEKDPAYYQGIVERLRHLEAVPERNDLSGEEPDEE